MITSLLAATMLAMLAPPAYSEGWVPEPTLAPSGTAGNALTNVSCVSASFCIALGENLAGQPSFGGSPVILGSFSEVWTGSAWTVVLTATSAGADPGLDAISCVSPSFCIAVGQSHSEHPNAPYHAQSSKGRPLIEEWNGASWTEQVNRGPSGGALFGVSCRSASFCIAVGSGKEGRDVLSERWDGTHWLMQRTPFVPNQGNRLEAVSCVAEGTCLAVGYHNTTPRGQALLVPLAERWDGHRWHVEYPPGHLPSEGVEMYGISCASRSFCLAAGSFAQGNGTVALSPFVERWNGVRWSHATAGLPDFSGLFGISCVSPSYCFAVGQYDPRIQPAAGSAGLLMESWNGVRWSRVAVPPAAEPVLPEGTTWIETDPAMLGISCVPLVGCTAVGDQGNGSNTAPLADSEAGAPARPPGG